ncbi:MAG TPA: outer membrane beta-barrel protein [Vicinamibacterales bacterium]|nr:outer membrane beta-barrel protein [Vicinamibacterales bacterium]
MNLRTFRALALACACLGVGVPAAAQEPEDPFETARFRLGPIRFTPAIQITSLGHDSNVFNEAENPKSDTTAAFGPAVELWVRPFGTRFNAKVGGQYLYFKEFDDQRAWNTNNEARWEVPLARLTPFVAGSYVNTRERQGYEIDSRSRRRDDSVTVGSSLRLSGKTALIVSYRQFNVKYDEEESFLGTALANALNRREKTTKVQLRYALTPLTTFVVDTDIGRDRFELTRLRDTDSVRVMPGFELKPLALISGRVFVGYRQFKPLTETLPEYRGVVASVKATYIRSSTRFELKVDRDLAYSYEPTRPYYALLDYGLTVTQRITNAWELVGRGSRQTLAYRMLDALDASSIPPGDKGYVYGGGVGYRLGETFRLGLDTNYYTRRSEIEGRRDFEGLRVFGSISYGIQQ